MEPLGPAPRGAIRGGPLPDDAVILGRRPEARTSENGEAPARGEGPGHIHRGTRLAAADRHLPSLNTRPTEPSMLLGHQVVFPPASSYEA